MNASYSSMVGSWDKSVIENPSLSEDFMLSSKNWTLCFCSGDSSFAKIKDMSSLEELISIDEGIGPDANRVWSKYNGWQASSFAVLVKRFIAIIDLSQEVNPEFIDSALDDDLSVLDAVSIWFKGTMITVEIEHHLNGQSGLLDVCIEGVNSVRRCVIDVNMKNNDLFNVYYGESSKGGAVWRNDLLTSLRQFFANEDAA